MESNEEKKGRELNIAQARMDKLDIDTIMATENGRRFMWRILSYCGIYRDPVGEQLDVYKQLGRRQVGLYLMSVLTDADDDKVFTMMKEAKNKAREEERAIRESREQDERERNNPDNYDDFPTVDRSGDVFI